MPAAPRSSASAVFELKSAALTLVAVVVKTPDLARLAAALDERLAETPGLFEHDPVVVDIAALRDGDSPVDFAALGALLRRHGMVPVAVKGGGEAQMAAAREAGYAEAPEGLSPTRHPQQPAAVVTAPAADATAPAGAEGHAVGAVACDPPAAPIPVAADAAEDLVPDPAPAAPTNAATKVIDRPLRSGQQVYARNADLVVLAAVSFGAEVIADGHIHVYAPLRGRAVAGAKGDTNARIFATCMEPQLIAIAGIYRTTETELPQDVLGKPAQVRLEGDRLVIEPLGH